MNQQADPSALEQISSMINRYNQLVSDIKTIDEIQKSKELEIQQFKQTMETELADLKLKISEIKTVVERATKYKTMVGREFKQIVKVDTLNRLSRRIDNQNFENRMLRKELYRILER